MNVVFFAIVLISFVVAAVRQVATPVDPVMATTPATGPMENVAKAAIESAGSAVELAIGLIGVMTLFLGLMKVAEAGGLLVVIARLVRPVMQRLFPDVPPQHPAMGAMIMNMSANVLGLGNAATPFGIRAIQELNRLNPFKGTATNAMVLFLAINTSSVTLLPTGVIGLRAAAGSADPAGIVPTTLFATICSTTVGIVMAKLSARFWPAAPDNKESPPPTDPEQPITDSQDPPDSMPAGLSAAAADKSYPVWVTCLVLAALAGLAPLTIFYGRTIAPWIVPALITGLLAYGMCNRVKIYEVFVEGAREGFQVAVRIIPYLVAILVAVGMFRASGALDLLLGPLSAVSEPLGMPGEAVPMALLRPLSGSGAFGLLASILNDPAIGPDSYTGYLVSTIQGSTDTTFFVIAVYFGAVGIRRIRHALIAGLTADLAGVIAAVFICSLLYKG